MAVWVLMATYNRATVTEQCLTALEEAARRGCDETRLVLLDDASSDDTPARVLRTWPQAHILRGDGSYYWARSMATAERQALEIAEQDDFLLWLNDDVRLDPDALLRLLAQARLMPGRVIVGATRSPSGDAITYAGYRRSGINPLSVRPVFPKGVSVPVDAFNGNIVLVPVSVARRMHGIDGHFAHGFADIDYGLRLKADGLPAELAPGTFGTCPRGDRRSARSFSDGWKAFRSPLGGGDFASLRRFHRRHAGSIWPILIAITYGKFIARQSLRAIVCRIHRRAS